MMPPRKDKYVMVNFRADPATLEAIDKLEEAFANTPGELSTNVKSRAIRKALIESAARLEK